MLGNWGSVSNNYLYTGQEYDGSISQLYNLRARLYDMRIGRFVVEDPIKKSKKPHCGLIFPQCQNLFLYVENSPINNSDLLGLQMIRRPLPSPYELYLGHRIYRYFWQQFTMDRNSRDKLYHCLVNCLLIREANWPPDFARGVGSFRERFFGVRDPEDEAANEKGIDCAFQKKISCVNCCREAYP
jgi:RHS repeat-associated protein